MGRLRTVAPLLVATVLAGVAVLTVQKAGCDDPGHYEKIAGGYVLVGGCLHPEDLMVPEPAQAPSPQPPDADAPARS